MRAAGLHPQLTVGFRMFAACPKTGDGDSGSTYHQRL